MKQINWFEKLIGSGIYTGYISIASGTFGSLVAIIIYLIPGFEKNLDRTAMMQYFGLGAVMDGRTFFTGISNLNPGSIIRIKNDSKEHQYDSNNIKINNN